MTTTPDIAELRPIEHISLPSIGELSIQGLTVLVGPNSSGKSQLLRDIYMRISGEPRKLVVAETLTVRRFDYVPFIGTLKAHGYVEEFEDEKGVSHLRPRTTYVGMNQGLGQIQKQQAQDWFTKHDTTSTSPSGRVYRDEFLYYFGRLLVTALFLENRLLSMNPVGYINFETDPPSHDLHALHMNDGAKRELLVEIQNSFGRCVWPDLNRGTGVGIRVCDGKTMPSVDEILFCQTMADNRYLETEGDGLKSYVAICVALLLGRRPICLVDEPEMCLHPPQAYNLGRFIGRIASASDRATFIATHSSHVLRGILQTANPVQIVRLTRRAGKFQAHRVEPDALQEALLRPTVRGETVLDGIFSEAVVVLEADGDRTVYQAVWETLLAEQHLDIHFTPVGGVGGIADTCKLYRTLRIPIAIIADLDMLTDLDRVRRALTEVSDQQDVIDGLVSRARSIMKQIQEIPPTISPDEVLVEIESIKSERRDWEKRDDALVRKRLLELSQKLNRMRGLKHGGIDSFDEPLKGELESLIDDLQDHGMFLVSVGELEQWLSRYDIKASKQNKWAWANEAAQKVRKLGAQSDDVWQFLRQVGRYLQQSDDPIA